MVGSWAEEVIVLSGEGVGSRTGRVGEGEAY